MGLVSYFFSLELDVPWASWFNVLLGWFKIEVYFYYYYYFFECIKWDLSQIVRIHGNNARVQVSTLESLGDRMKLIPLRVSNSCHRNLLWFSRALSVEEWLVVLFTRCTLCYLIGNCSYTFMFFFASWQIEREWTAFIISRVISFCGWIILKWKIKDFLMQDS